MYKHYILDSLDDIELINILPKLALLNLSKVQHILYHELEAERRGLLYFNTFFQLRNYVEATFYETGGLWVVLILVTTELDEKLFQLLVEILVFNDVRNDRVQRISHFMGNAGIYKLQSLTVSLLIIIENTL